MCEPGPQSTELSSKFEAQGNQERVWTRTATHAYKNKEPVPYKVMRSKLHTRSAAFLAHTGPAKYFEKDRCEKSLSTDGDETKQSAKQTSGDMRDRLFHRVATH